MNAFSNTRRVEFGDTDMAGIMHFSNFFRFMEVAETEFLRSKGLTVNWKQGGEQFGFPRVSASCDYHKPAKFEDVLTIRVVPEQIGSRSVRYRFEFERGGEKIATGRMTAVYCRKTENGIESLEIPAEIRSKLEA